MTDQTARLYNIPVMIANEKKLLSRIEAASFSIILSFHSPLYKLR